MQFLKNTKYITDKQDLGKEKEDIESKLVTTDAFNTKLEKLKKSMLLMLLNLESICKRKYV